MKKHIFIATLLIFLGLQCKSLSSVKQNPLSVDVCPNFGFLDLNDEQKGQAYSFGYFTDWQERQELEANATHKNDKRMYEDYVRSKNLDIREGGKFEISIIALKSTKDETILVPLDLAVNAKTIVNSQDAMNVWNHFYFRLCPDEKEIKNYNQTEYASKVLKIKEELTSAYGNKSIKELTTYIMKISKQIDNERGDMKELLLKKRVAWTWFIERLEKTTKNYIKVKYPNMIHLTEKSVSFFDKNDYPRDLFVFHRMFRVLFRENPSSPGGIAESTFRLEKTPKSKIFNLVHTILRADNTEYPIANFSFVEEGDEIFITKLLEEKNTEPKPKWEYVAVNFFNEIVGIMGSYDFDLRYVNSSRFDQYEPRGK
ncbi:MAG: hypothetical protein O9264_13055 [Leptospira sp.]|nr:hypothetical protein [Leptospira sp.]